MTAQEHFSVHSTQPYRPKGTNIDNLQRSISILGGGTVLLLGVRRPSLGGFLLTLAGTALLHRGITGHCVGYAALGKTSNGAASVKTDENVARDIHVEKSITINRDAAELYEFWREFENLPGIMRHLESVTRIDELHSNWVVIGPAGKRFEWDAEIYNESKNEMIAWRSLPGADIVNAGSVRFEPAPSGRGTYVRVVLNYNVPGGKLSAFFAKGFGSEPGQLIEDDLRRFKQLMEAGEIATTEGQPTGVAPPSKTAERKASKRALGSRPKELEQPRTRTQVA